MEFIETPIFTKLVGQLLSDDDYSDLQEALIGNPKIGHLIRGGNGLRKMRWLSSLGNRGKRGGVRIIYYNISNARILMIFGYAKSDQENMTTQQLNSLKTLAKGKLYERK